MSSATGLQVLDQAGPAPRASWARRCRLVLLVGIVTTIMSLGSVLMLAAALVTLFQARRFYTEVIARSLGRAVLWVCGVKVVVHQEEPLPHGQVVYISNHTSSLDVFVLIALGLPNARFFLWGGLRKILPLGMMGYLTGTIWTVSQSLPRKRAQLFARAERILRRTGESVYLSPEGVRVTTGEIGHFNKGAFHLATNLHAPIVPFYIAIPREINPGTGLDARPGVVHVYFHSPLPTHDWKLEDLEQNRKRVRDFFVQLHEEWKASRP